MREGSIFHSNLLNYKGLKGGEGVKDVLGSFSCYWQLMIQNTEARSHRVIPLPDSYETLCLCVSVFI